MELTSHNVSLLNGSGKPGSILCSCNNAVIAVSRIIRMYELFAVAFLCVSQKCVFTADVQPVPSHVRNIQLSRNHAFHGSNLTL